MENEMSRHVFSFNKRDNGGEQLILVTNICHNGDGVDGIYYSQELTLCSYCNSAILSFSGIQITPNLLGQLANELEIETNKVKAILERKKNV